MVLMLVFCCRRMCRLKCSWLQMQMLFHNRKPWVFKMQDLSDSQMLFIPCQIHSHPCWLPLSPTVKRGHVSQTFHIMNSNPPSVCFPLSRLMFPQRAPPGSLSSLTADSSPPLSGPWVSRSIASSSSRQRRRLRCSCQPSSWAHLPGWESIAMDTESTYSGYSYYSGRSRGSHRHG